MPAGTTALRCHCQFIRFRLNFCLCARKAFAARADCINDIIGQVNHCCIVSLFAVACTVLQTPAGMPQGGLEPLRMPPVFRAKAAEYSFVPSRYCCEDGAVEFLMSAPGAGKRNAYPLLVYIPGSGERGSATNQFRQTALFDKVLSPTFQKKHPCFLMAISPPASAMTLLDGLPGRPSKIQNMIADAIERVVSTAVAPAVDRDRIYLAGFSYGGAGVYGLMTSLPEMFAAGVAVSTFPQNRAVACCVDDIRPKYLRHGSSLSLCNLAVGAGPCPWSQGRRTSYRCPENPFEKTSCIWSDLGAMDRFRYGVVSG